MHAEKDLQYDTDLMQCLAGTYSPSQSQKVYFIQKHNMILSAKNVEQTLQASEHQRPAILVDQSRIWSSHPVDVGAIQKQ